MLSSQAVTLPAFEQFAPSYDQATPIQSAVAQALAQQIAPSFCQPNLLSRYDEYVVVDVGCGTGKLTVALLNVLLNETFYPRQVTLYGVDNAVSMLTLWQQNMAKLLTTNTPHHIPQSYIQQSHAVLSAMQAIALPNQMADMVISSFALHWALPAVIDEVGRLVKANGQLHLAIPVKGSFGEVSVRFAELPIFEFLPSTTWQTAIEQLVKKRQGKLLYQYEQRFFYQYDNLSQLLKYLKQMGGAVSGRQPLTTAKLRSYLKDTSAVNLDYQMLMVGVSL